MKEIWHPPFLVRMEQVAIVSLCIMSYTNGYSKACDVIAKQSVDELYKPFLAHPGSSLSELPIHPQLWPQVSDRMAKLIKTFTYKNNCKPNWSILVLGASYDISKFQTTTKIITPNVCKVIVEFLNKSVPITVDVRYTDVKGYLGIDEIEGRTAGRTYSLQYILQHPLAYGPQLCLSIY